MNSKKKIWAIALIVLIIVIALAGTVAGMVMTGKVAITNKQKIAKGISDITSEMKISQLEDSYKEYQKLQTTPFEEETIITANVNQMNFSNTVGVEDTLNEIKDVVENTKIVNTIQADLKNNIIKENLKIKLADIVDEISADVEYNDERLSLKSEQLNDKYITFTKDEAYIDSAHQDLVDIIELFENICRAGKTDIFLTESDKNHFNEQYKDIFSDYITDDMIKEEKSSISVDGQVKECTNINFTLNKNQIVELVGKYLSKLEQDTEGRKIIVTKIQLIENNFEDKDLLKIIEDLKKQVSNLEDNASIKVSTYCTMFNTYGMDIELDDGYTKNKISIILGDKNDEIYVTVNDNKIMEVKKSDNETIIECSVTGISIVMNIKDVDDKLVISLQLKDSKSKMEIDMTLTSQEVSKNNNMETSKGTIEIELKVGENNVNVALDVNSTLKYVDSIDTITLDDSNSLNLVKCSDEELQQYLEEFTSNAKSIMHSIIQDAETMQSVNNIVKGSSGFIDGNSSTLKDPKTFNDMFRNYTGNKEGSAMKELLQTLSSNNEVEDIKVTVSIVVDGNMVLNPTSDAQELSNAVELNIKDDMTYTILVTSLNDEGYITGIEIKNI